MSETHPPHRAREAAPATLPRAAPPDFRAPFPVFTESTDRLMHAVQGRFTMALSPASLLLAYLDWLVHLSNSPGKIDTRSDADRYVAPESWEAATPHREGSWWQAWQGWIAAHSTGRTAPPAIGAPEIGYPPLAEAPGSYVLMP